MTIKLEEEHETDKPFEKNQERLEMELSYGEETTKVAVFGVVTPQDMQLFHKWLSHNMSAHAYGILRKRMYHEYSVAVLDGRVKDRFHTHPQMQQEKGIDDKHVIIDREAADEILCNSPTSSP